MQYRAHSQKNEEIVARYLSEVVPGNWPLSVSDSIVSLRIMSGDESLRFEDIEPILTRQALERGLNVHFDGSVIDN